MKFKLFDDIISQDSDRIRAVKHVSLAEEYLADHFPTFPVLPGVLMIEAMVQAARTLLEARGEPRMVLGEVRALKFGSMVRPGEALELDVSIEGPDRPRGPDDANAVRLRGVGVVRRWGRGDDRRDGETAVSGRFTMRPIRTEPAP